MYIRLSKGNTAKFTKVYLVEGYRDENGKSKQRVIRSYGNLEELEVKEPDVLNRLRLEAKTIKKNEVKITLNLSDLNDDTNKDKNYGYFFLDSIYKTLAIGDFIESYNFETKFKYDLNKILRLLTFSRILNPMSKKATVENKDMYFENFNVDLKSVYKSLSNLSEIKIDLQNHLNKTVSETYGRDASLVFYDVTNYYFETETKDENGEKVILKEKVVCFWSKNFDDREKHKREKLEERITAYLESPSKYKSSNSYGIKKYLKLQNLDKKTGEIKDIEPYIEFDEEKYKRDVSLDGYYTIVTSELNLSNEEVIKKYRGLWKIEESFRVLKTDLEGRPVYVRNEDHIEGHFLVCFIALLISRILEMKLDNKYSIRRIQESLKSATCRELTNGIYSLNKQNENYRKIEALYKIEMNYKNIRIEILRKYRKEIVHNVKK